MWPIRYNVAASLDGYIAGPEGEFDWMPMDPSVDFAGIFAKVDTVEITVVPILLGGGVPLLQPGGPRTVLTLTGTRTYPSGLVTLSYMVEHAAA